VVDGGDVGVDGGGDLPRAVTCGDGEGQYAEICLRRRGYLLGALLVEPMDTIPRRFVVSV
jgi:hypothetical protein